MEKAKEQEEVQNIFLLPSPLTFISDIYQTNQKLAFLLGPCGAFGYTDT